MWSKILHAIGLKHIHNKLDAEDIAFMSYVTEYGKSYGTQEEYEFRSVQFKKNLKMIGEHNSSNGTFELGVNHMMDWTHSEYKRLLGYKPELRTEAKNTTPEILSTENLADSLDWSTKGAVTKIKNQGQCGSCWAFSTTGSVEGAEFLHGSKTLTSLSEQQLVDCSKQNSACQGGLMDYAFKYIEKAPLMTESEYPYTGRHSILSRCKYEESKGVGHVKSFKDVSPNQADQLKAALANGPVSVAIEADKGVFQMYKTGVLNSATCGTHLDHGVLAVGYGTEGGVDYFKVKNSWGPSWGDSGYVKIGANNICGILMQPSYPTE